MIHLDDAQLEAIGLKYVLGKLAADSPYGAEKIRQMPPFTVDDRMQIEHHFDNIERAMSLLANSSSQLDNLRRSFMQLKNIRGIIDKCSTHTLNEVELFEVKIFLLTHDAIWHAFQEVTRETAFHGISLMPMQDLLNVLDPERKRIASFALEEVHDAPELGKIRREKLRVEALLESADDAQVPALLRQRSDVVSQEAEAEASVMERLTCEIRGYRAMFYANFDNIGTLDMIIAKAVLACEHHAVRPKISTRKTVSFSGMSNPYLAEILACGGRELTKVSLTLAPGTTIITGANMGGKSVALKTTVLNIAIAMLGCFVFAREAEVPLSDGVCLISEDMQDMKGGLSSFGAEVARMCEFVDMLRGKFLIVALDELARGTNPTEGAAIVRGVASYMNDSGSVCVIATHYDGVAQHYKHYRTAGLRVPADLDANAVYGPELLAQYMDYSLIEAHGAAVPQDAYNVCRLMGVDAALMERISREYGVDACKAQCNDAKPIL